MVLPERRHCADGSSVDDVNIFINCIITTEVPEQKVQHEPHKWEQLCTLLHPPTMTWEQLQLEHTIHAELSKIRIFLKRFNWWYETWDFAGLPTPFLAEQMYAPVESLVTEWSVSTGPSCSSSLTTPSLLRWVHSTLGQGFPLALHSRFTLAPLLTTISPLDGSGLTEGGTEI